MALSVIYFLDNDIILKLSAFNLLDAAIAALKISPENLRVLDTAQHVFKRNRKVSQKYSEVTRERAIDFVKSCQTVKPVDSPEFIVLGQMLDVGEATLVAATREVSPFIFMTGDKRCLRDLATKAELTEVAERLRGRVICLEQVILLLIRQQGFEIIKQYILPMLDCDTSLKACFGSGEKAIERNVIEALEGYITDLEKSSIGLLAHLSQF